VTILLSFEFALRIGGLFVLIVTRPWLLLLLAYALLLFRRLIDQCGSRAVFVSVFGKCQPSLRYV
jgi:hypothetical protein